jgi:hypothetical protein
MATLTGPDGVEKRNNYTGRGQGLVKLSHRLEELHEYALPLPAVARARSVIALDKYASSATATQLTALANKVDAKLKAGGSLDDAATEIPISF